MNKHNIVVKRRTHVPTHGWNQGQATAPSYTPNFEELVYAIFDAQREIIGGIQPKRFKCKTPVTVKSIERLFHMSPDLMTFDGMSHADAMTHFYNDAVKIGVRNSMSVPFIFAKEIRVFSIAFSGPAFIFKQENGFRYQVLATQQEFHTMATSRYILNNLSFHLNLKYQCNLHIAADEAQRVYEQTGMIIPHNRHLFTRACDYYLNPQLLNFFDFVRCQIKSLRGTGNETIEAIITGSNPVSSELKLELDYALKIHSGEVRQFLGDYSDEQIVDFQ